jgi:nucleoside-diphosphate-sugar epimerase
MPDAPAIPAPVPPSCAPAAIAAQPSTVLILGANGRLGHAVARAFLDAGWTVLAQARRPVEDLAGARTLATPVADTAQLAALARGATVVVHAMNPLYTRWNAEALPLADAAIEVARALGATLMFPGNVYNFGDPIAARLGETTPQRPDHPKAALRIATEQKLAAAAAQGTQSIVIRAGDFFGGRPGSWFDLAITKDLARGRIVYPGPRTLAHAWAYLPDLARVFVAVAERRAACAPFEVLHFEGHTLTGAQMVETIAAAARRIGLPVADAPRIGTLPWPMIRALGLFAPMMRELARMSYLWRQPHQLLQDRLVARIGAVPHTPLPQAVEAALHLQFRARALPPAPLTAAA